MNLFLRLSEFLIPVMIFWIIGYGMLSRIPLYDCFVRGAGEGIRTVAGIAPTLVGLMTAVGVLRASGALELIGEILSNLFQGFVFPEELIPLSLVRMFSSSAATGLLIDVYKEYGTDSLTGLTASLMMCCTETVFYTMSLYFMTAGIKKTRHTLAGALLATAAGIMASVSLAGGMI